jgi:lambda repressor-like predicted transcriptional regulator
MIVDMDETRINTIPAHDMSIDDRLDEIAHLMMRGVKRLKAKSKRHSLNSYFSGLRTELKRSCDKGDQINEQHPNHDSIGTTAKHADTRPDNTLERDI